LFKHQREAKEKNTSSAKLTPLTRGACIWDIAHLELILLPGLSFENGDFVAGLVLELAQRLLEVL